MQYGMVNGLSLVISVLVFSCHALLCFNVNVVGLKKINFSGNFTSKVIFIIFLLTIFKCGEELSWQLHFVDSDWSFFNDALIFSSHGTYTMQCNMMLLCPFVKPILHLKRTKYAINLKYCALLDYQVIFFTPFLFLYSWFHFYLIRGWLWGSCRRRRWGDGEDA